LHALSVGQPVSAYLSPDPSKKFKRDYLIGKSLANDRMAEVYCHFNHYNASLVPDMFMNEEVSIESKNALSVPEGAVIRRQNKSFVFVERDSGGFELVEIEPGAITEGFQQIGGPGIGAESNVIVRNAYSLLMKMKNIEEEDDQPFDKIL